MNVLQRIFAFLFVAVLSGCASQPSLTQNQCVAGDWQTVGYRDGATGASSTRLLTHQEACGEYGIIPSREAYLAGWHNGIADYCNPDNAYELGLRGRTATSLCPSHLRAAFADAYSDGYRQYKVRQEILDLERSLDAHQQRLLAIKHEIVTVSSAQLLPDLSAQERIELLAEFEALLAERSAILDAIPELEAQLLEAESRLTHVEQLAQR